MLFNPNFVDEALTLGAKKVEKEENTKAQHQVASPLIESYKMFSPTSPSPTRSMIKEANDHLQLLHQRVMDLEKTVQEQAEALIKKDEVMQLKLTELSEMKDAVIGDLKQTVTAYDQRVKKLEQQNRESCRLLEAMNQKCLGTDELDVYIPTLEKLLASMRKLTNSKQRSLTNNVAPSTSNCVNSLNPFPKSNSFRSRKIFRASNQKGNSDKCKEREREVVLTSDGSGSLVDGLAPEKSSSTSNSNNSVLAVSSLGLIQSSSSTSQLPIADLRIGRSFNINSNFSMSEDEDDNDKYS